MDFDSILTKIIATVSGVWFFLGFIATVGAYLDRVLTVKEAWFVMLLLFIIPSLILVQISAIIAGWYNRTYYTKKEFLLSLIPLLPYFVLLYEFADYIRYSIQREVYRLQRKRERYRTQEKQPSFWDELL